MGNIIHSSYLAATSTPAISLTVTGSSATGYQATYTAGSTIFLPVGISKISITLNANFGDSSSAVIYSYASTNVTGELSQLSVKDYKTPVTNFYIAQIGFPGSITLQLLPNQVVYFGLLVLITPAQGNAITLFCDPQASNDPKTTGTP